VTKNIYQQNHSNCNHTLLIKDWLSWQLQWSAEMFCRNWKINFLTTNHITTHRHNDELKNMFFKNNPGKIASLNNYKEFQVKQ